MILKQPLVINFMKQPLVINNYQLVKIYKLKFILIIYKMDKLLPNGRHEVYYISPEVDNNDVQLDKFLCTGDRCKLETNFKEISGLKITKEKTAPMISTNIDDPKKQYVLFNAGTTGSEKIKYFLQNIYITSPSIHSINISSPMDGEAILVLKSDAGQFLYLCVLLQQGSSIEGKIQYSLFSEINKCMNSPNNTSATCESYSPNDFIPKNSPFVLYLTNVADEPGVEIYDKANLFCVVVFTTPVIIPSSFINSFKTTMYSKVSDYNMILSEKPIIRSDINYYLNDGLTKGGGSGSGSGSGSDSGSGSGQTVDHLRKKLCKSDDTKKKSSSGEALPKTVTNLETNLEAKIKDATTGSTPFYRSTIFWIILGVYFFSWGVLAYQGILKNKAYWKIATGVVGAPLYILINIIILTFETLKSFVSQTAIDKAKSVGKNAGSIVKEINPLGKKNSSVNGQSGIEMTTSAIGQPSQPVTASNAAKATAKAVANADAKAVANADTKAVLRAAVMLGTT